MGWKILSIGLLLCLALAAVESVRVQTTGSKSVRGKQNEWKFKLPISVRGAVEVHTRDFVNCQSLNSILIGNMRMLTDKWEKRVGNK